MLANRLRKRQRHLRKWAQKNDITCYRLYERDIPEYPAIVDWYDGEAVVWLYTRKRDETKAEQNAWRQHTLKQIQEGLDIPPEKLYVKERGQQKGLDVQYERLGQAEQIRLVQEQGLTFEVNLSDYLDTGLFLDHRQTRALVREMAAGLRFLNLFAYTGSFTVYACHGRATATTTVDLSQTYCDWAARNLAHNGFLTGPAQQIIQADCLQFLQEAARRRDRFDLIVCDPPTFSNSKRMKAGSFVIDRDYPGLLAACVAILAPQGSLIFSTNSRGFKFDPATLPPQMSGEEISQKTVPEDFRNRQIHRCWHFKKIDA